MFIFHDYYKFNFPCKAFEHVFNYKAVKFPVVKGQNFSSVPEIFFECSEISDKRTPPNNGQKLEDRTKLVQMPCEKAPL